MALPKPHGRRAPGSARRAGGEPLRTAFIEALTELAGEDPRICLIVGDLGYSVIERFADLYPRQFVNAGVAEQNMTGVAAGLALSGRIVFTYSIANFSTLRCLEQIRNDVCYHDLNVKVVAVGGGLAYGNLGSTHHATEDFAVMRSLPGMTVVAPGDPQEARAATQILARRPGPAYLRLGKTGEPSVHGPGTGFRLGRAQKVREGEEVILMAIGSMLPVACSAAELLDRQSLEVGVISMHTLSPLDTDAIFEAATRSRLVVTVEEHSVVGGLGSAVSEVVAAIPNGRAVVKRLGVPSGFSYRIGSQQYLRSAYSLTPQGIVLGVEEALAGL